MAQSLTCLEKHKGFLELYASGIWVCRLCANKNEMAQDARNMLLRLKLMLGIPAGMRIYAKGQWKDL